MCLACVDYFKGSLTFKEAMRNLAEMAETAKTQEELGHIIDIRTKIAKDLLGVE